MRTTKKYGRRKKRAGGCLVVLMILCLLVIAGLVTGYFFWRASVKDAVNEETVAIDPTQAPPTQPTEPPHNWEPGFVATLNLTADYCDENGNPLGTLVRGAQVEYELTDDGRTSLLVDDDIVYLQEGAYVVDQVSDSVPAHTLYARTAVNLQDPGGWLFAAFAQKGTAVTVTGCDYVLEDGQVHMYRVNLDGQEGYILPWYLVDNEADALANYDNGSYAIHADRADRYGGGDAASLDYFPREKGAIPGNEMPEECRTLYLVNWRLSEVDSYIKIAESSGINAFVVDIVDGGSVGYAGDVMKLYCPSGAAAANNTVEEYQAAIRKLKDAGYYVIGRITTFNDSYFVQDHPECAIVDAAGAPLKISGAYWPTPYNRTAWQYKVDLAVEAVALMGFNEIQFDYVRFPDGTWSYENAGNIDYRNVYGETKAQAIQRFLMFATDLLHRHGAYVSADVFGESAYTYVTAYGQYWPAISNVVDAISGMPYPDHFGYTSTWRPWEHPYDTLYDWGCSVMNRQGETTTPAAVRTWIQAYDAIREPYNVYGPDEVFAQIKALRDSGCAGGYMTWNATSSIDKYTSLIPAFAPPEEEI